MLEQKKVTFSTYREFWPHYLKEHSRPGTQIVHAIGLMVGLLFAIIGFITGQYLFLLAGLITGYGLAWAAHFLIERNRPATLHHPLWSFISDFRMVWELVLGKGPSKR